MKEQQTSNNHLNANGVYGVLANVVSQDLARKLARIGWKQGQTNKSYHKRPNCSIYDLKNMKGVAGWGWDAPDELELKKMCKLVDCKPNEDIPDLIATHLIAFCKSLKTKLSSYIIC